MPPSEPVVEEEHPAAEAEVQPEPAVGNALEVDWNSVFPPTNRYRQAIIDYLTPELFVLLRDPNSRMRPPRDIVNDALDRCRHTYLWGQYGVYTRRRSVADAVIMHYFNPLQQFIAERFA